MATATLNKAVDKITDDVISPGAENKASTVIKAVCISTSKKSVKDAKKLVETLEDIIKDKLPTTMEEFDQKIVQDNYVNINENLQKVETFLSFIAKIFDSGHDIEMDEEVMFNFLANMQKAQKHLSYISDYLGLVLQVQNEKNAAKKTTSFAELLNQINAA